MAKRPNHTVGLDIGTSKVTCIVAAANEENLMQIVGMGEAESRGLRKGVIVNPDAAVESIKRVVEEAERMSGTQAEEVTINLAGSHIMGFNGQAIVAVANRDRMITADDVRRAIDSACAIQLPAGREIVDRLPQEFIVDDQDGINDPVGMTGARLAVKVHIVTSPITARQNAINAVNRAGLIVADMILEQLAAAEASLTEDDKEYGAALVDIGAETTGLCVYQRGAVQHTAVFPLGGAHFTNDIAFGLRTPIPEAERIKRSVGCASSASLSDEQRGEMVEVLDKLGQLAKERADSAQRYGSRSCHRLRLRPSNTGSKFNLYFPAAQAGRRQGLRRRSARATSSRSAGWRGPRRCTCPATSRRWPRAPARSRSSWLAIISAIFSKLGSDSNAASFSWHSVTSLLSRSARAPSGAQRDGAGG